MSLVFVSSGAFSQVPSVKVLQEGLAGYSGSQDAWINKGKKVKNFGSKRVLKYKARRFNLLVEFPIFHSEGGPVPDGSDIQSATLSLYKKSSSGQQALSATRLLEAWDEESVNWNQRADGAPWSSPGAKRKGQDIAAQADGVSTVGAGPQWLDIDVSEGVRQMSLGNLENHGWLIGGANQNKKVAKFFSREAASRKAQFRPKLTITYTPPSPGMPNDTGLTACIDEQGAEQDCPVSGLPGQDAEYGRDVTHNDDSDGHAGFSFTKLDENGDALPANAAEWSCVRDNVTGLIWEVKNQTGGLHYAGNTYTWYGSNVFGEYQDDFDQYVKDGGECIGSRCDTEGFVEAVNRSGLCGKNDWRMPTNAELVNLIDFSRLDISFRDVGINFDSTYFPNSLTASYWTNGYIGSVYATAVGVFFGIGGGIHMAMPVRLVRGVDAALLESPLTMDGDEVTDRRTGLIWRRCPLGYEWVSDSAACEAIDGQGLLVESWSDAMDRVEALRQESGKNWRVANIKELYSVMTPAPDQLSSDPKFYTSEITFPQTAVLPIGVFGSSTLLPIAPIAPIAMGGMGVTMVELLNWIGGELVDNAGISTHEYALLLVRDAQ